MFCGANLVIDFPGAGVCRLRVRRTKRITKHANAKAGNEKWGSVGLPGLKKETARKSGRFLIGGGGEIRTHEGLSSLPVFKTGAFNRSATPPIGEP